MENNNNSMPMLFPIQPEIFLARMREIVREEIRKLEPKRETQPSDEPLLTRQEIASFLRISLVTLHDWMKNRGLPYHQRRRGPRFIKSEVLKWLKDKKGSD